jgi:hypothetical protein
MLWTRDVILSYTSHLSWAPYGRNMVWVSHQRLFITIPRDFSCGCVGEIKPTHRFDTSRCLVWSNNNVSELIRILSSSKSAVATVLRPLSWMELVSTILNANEIMKNAERPRVYVGVG